MPASPDPAAGPGPDLDGALARARMLFSLLSAPRLRSGLAEMLAGDGRPTDGQGDSHGDSHGQGRESLLADPGVRGPLSRLDWIDTDGEVDIARLRGTVGALEVLRSDRAMLELGRLEGIPASTDESRALCGRIARIVFERVGRDRTLSEGELNSALAMFVADVALARRDAVDSGVLERTADGSAYRLAPAAG